MMSRKYKIQLEQISVMNKLLNDALRAKGYAGPDIKMVLTDVTDPNGPFYTDTLTNVVVFDRKILASLDRDKILNILGHEFGHYSKEDNKTGTQTIANYSGDKLEDRTKVMVAKEATEDTLASIRNNPNVITGEEEYGWIWKVEGAAGVNYNLKDIKKEVMPVKFDFGIEGYEKKGKPIKNL